MKYCDLHCHSLASDGTASPAEVARIMKAADSAAFAMTDHETVWGNKEAQKEALKLGINFIPGVEMSCDFAGAELHIVGLFIEPDCSALTNVLELQREKRAVRNKKIFNKIISLGIELDEKDFAESDVITRGHFAKKLHELGYAKTVKEAYVNYLIEGGKAFVESERMSAKTAIETIKKANGTSVFAHLNTYRIDAFKAADELQKMGLDGIEALYFEYSPEFSEKCIRFAETRGFFMSGGSDFHGKLKPNIPCVGRNDGEKIPFSVYENLLEYRRKRC